MFAIAQIQGNQYTLKEGDTIRAQKIDAPKGSNYLADYVLFVSDGKQSYVGKPYLEDYTVEFEVVDQGLGDKIRVFKMKAKKRYRRTFGHRQAYTDLKVIKIFQKGVASKAEEASVTVSEVSEKKVARKPRTTKKKPSVDSLRNNFS